MRVFIPRLRIEGPRPFLEPGVTAALPRSLWLAPEHDLAGRRTSGLKSVAGLFGSALAVLLCACGPLAVPHFRLAEIDRPEVIVREFDPSDEALRPLGATLSRSLAEILQNRGILAPIVAADEPLPPYAHALIEGRISYAGRGALSADARLVDLDRDKVLLEHRFRERAMTFFGEGRALHRDAREIGREIADWATGATRLAGTPGTAGCDPAHWRTATQSR